MRMADLGFQGPRGIRGSPGTSDCQESAANQEHRGPTGKMGLRVYQGPQARLEFRASLDLQGTPARRATEVLWVKTDRLGPRVTTENQAGWAYQAIRAPLGPVDL